jgi:hypothetical protein
MKGFLYINIAFFAGSSSISPFCDGIGRQEAVESARDRAVLTAASYMKFP